MRNSAHGEAILKRKLPLRQRSLRADRAAEAGYCHCTRCQHRSGAAASASAPIDGSTLRFHCGEELVKAWRPPGDGAEKLFCRECGGHLFSRNPHDHAQMSVRLGAFDGDPGVRPSSRQYVAYAADWEPIPDDGLPRHPEARSA
ncbi:MAG: GFA family protein [Solirubrobacteraceae bacterium]